jgi:hypothetical protein
VLDQKQKDPEMGLFVFMPTKEMDYFPDAP